MNPVAEQASDQDACVICTEGPHGSWGKSLPAGYTHCKTSKSAGRIGCHRTFRRSEVHCNTCHETFKSDRADVLHFSESRGCQPPVEVKGRSGKSLLKALESAFGLTWSTVGRGEPPSARRFSLQPSPNWDDLDGRAL